MKIDSPLRQALKLAIDKIEREMITVALRDSKWNRKVAARKLGISYRSMLYKIEQHRVGTPEVTA